jgi:hypothetical protein
VRIARRRIAELKRTGIRIGSAVQKDILIRIEGAGIALRGDR